MNFIAKPSMAIRLISSYICNDDSKSRLTVMCSFIQLTTIVVIMQHGRSMHIMSMVIATIVWLEIPLKLSVPPAQFSSLLSPQSLIPLQTDVSDIHFELLQWKFPIPLHIPIQHRIKLLINGMLHVCIILYHSSMNNFCLAMQLLNNIELLTFTNSYLLQFNSS